VRAFVKLPLAAWARLSGGQPPGVAFLIYHSVAGRTRLELDTPFPVFRRQIEHLAAAGGFVSYEEAVDALKRGELAGGRFVLTFDDGFADTAGLAFPLLRDLGVPFVVFATTGLLERDPAAMRGWPHAGRLPPMSWDELGALRDSGLVTVGAHGHTHANLDALGESQVQGEIGRSQELFRERLGFEPVHFAYPRAVRGAAADRVVRARYATAVVGGGRRATPSGIDTHAIPRVPVRRSDGWVYFREKIAGRLAGEERLYATLRRIRRALTWRRGAR
jgi:peptidoglycan/xylan/chitin deacetylase (PgdA/CDA1 family)